MATSGESSWPPAYDQLNFTNCTVAAYWLAAYLDQRYYDTPYQDAPSGATLDYLESIIPDNISYPSVGDIFEWYATMDDATWEGLIMFPIANCSEALCKQLRWEGDQDLAGIGVSEAMATIASTAAHPQSYFLGHGCLLYSSRLVSGLLRHPVP